MVKCLVTGGSGFIGSHLVKRLIQNGDYVRVLIRNTSNTKIFEGLDLDIEYGDITDKKCVFQIMKGIENVYHLAAAYRETKLSNKIYWMTNVDGTRNLLEASLKEDIEMFLHCSTVGVHGHITKPPANENASYNPGDVYQKTKVEAEKLAKSYYVNEGLPIITIRPAGVYGPRELRFLRLFKAINSGKFIMVGKGDIFYHMCHISDLIDGMVLASNNEKAIGETYILAGEKFTTLKQLIEIIAEALGVPPPKKSFPFFKPVYLISFFTELISKPFGIEPPIHRRRIDIFRKSRAFDITKAKNELGFAPKIDLETGIKLTAEWYKKNGYL